MYPFLWGSIKAVSRALVAVVPTAKTFLPFALVALTKSMTSGFTSTYSSWISWSFIFAVLTGWKVPAPTLKLILITLTPFPSNFFGGFGALTSSLFLFLFGVYSYVIGLFFSFIGLLLFFSFDLFGIFFVNTRFNFFWCSLYKIFCFF